MSSIIRTFDALSEIRVGDYVQFHEDRLGYVQSISDNNVVKILEANDGVVRPRHYHVRQNQVVVVPTVGEYASQNRNLLQPPPANVNVASQLIEGRSEDTKELIKVMKETTLWSPYDRTNSDPFFDYLDKYKEKSKGWIRKVLPEYFRTDKQRLTNKERMILITMYNLFSGFSKIHGKFKG